MLQYRSNGTGSISDCLHIRESIAILHGRFSHILESFSPSLSSNLIPFGVCSTLTGLGRNLVGPNMSAIIDLSFVQHVLTPHFLNCKRYCEIWQCLRIQSSLGYFWYLESSLNFPTLFTAITGEPSRTSTEDKSML